MKQESSGGELNLQAVSDGLISVVKKAGASVVSIHARRRIPSSGVIWRNGVVVSADHTIRRDDDITISCPDGTRAPATLAGRDGATDLAVLKIGVADLPPVELNDVNLSVGQLVLAVGRADQLSASLGVIGSLAGPWRTWQGGRIDQLIRSDVSIFDGFSGGPLVDMQGRVIGINTSGLWRNSAVTVPAATVDRVAKELNEKGRVERGYLGVGLQTVRIPDSMLKGLGKEAGRAGLVIVNVESGSPAERAGMLLGDVLIELGGAPVADPGDVQEVLGRERVGRPLSASVIRAGAVSELTLTVGGRPAAEAR